MATKYLVTWNDGGTVGEQRHTVTEEELIPFVTELFNTESIKNFPDWGRVVSVKTVEDSGESSL